MAVDRRVAMTRARWRCGWWSGLRRRRHRGPVQLVPNSPGALDPRGDLGRGRLGGRYRGDDVDELDALLSVDGAGTPDLGDLDGVGEVEDLRRGGDLDRAPHPSPVGAVDAAGGPDLGPWQRFAAPVQAGSVGRERRDTRERRAS